MRCGMRGLVALVLVALAAILFWSRLAGKLGGLGGLKYPASLPALRRESFAHMRNDIYFDFTGSGLYSTQQLDDVFNDYRSHLYGNAHSQSPCSRRTEAKVEEVRDEVLNFFHTSSSQYTVIFTSGCTAALKLVGEGFPWASESEFLYLIENHNSLLGIREYAHKAGASFRAIGEESVERMLQAPPGARREAASPSLFGYPAEENFSGMKYPLGWIEQMQSRGYRILLDAAAFVPTAPLNLSVHRADFVTLSFYKMFGFPTGLGALLVRNDALPLLQPTYWGGGTVIAALSQEQFHAPRTAHPYERFEAGTLPFLEIIAVRYGLQRLEHIGMDYIQSHTYDVTRRIFRGLRNLKHRNGHAMVEIYGRHKAIDDLAAEKAVHLQGDVVTFNLMDNQGNYMSHSALHQAIEQRYIEMGSKIHLRTGCTCNPGACARALDMDGDALRRNAHQARISCLSDERVGEKPYGGARLSLGYVNTHHDAEQMISFIRDNFQQ